MKRAILILAVCFAGTASADIISVSGNNFLAVDSGGNLGAGTPLYNLSPSQNQIDSLMTFDLAPYSGETIGAGTLTMTDASLCCGGTRDTSLQTDLSIYSLTAAYNPATATLANVPYSSATLLDTESYDIPSFSAQIPLAFTISSALLQQWANNPSSSYGFIVVESNSFTAPGAGHSDILWIASGQGAPVLSFDASPDTAPEPATLFLIVPALVGICFLRRG